MSDQLSLTGDGGRGASADGSDGRPGNAVAGRWPGADSSLITHHASLRRALTRLGTWSAKVLGRPLRPYQLEPAGAVLRSIRDGRGEAITVMMSRQAGKNELSGHLESFLLARSQGRPETIVKAAPTFKPQIVNSMMRLKTCLDNPLTANRWHGELGYIVAVGRARALFFSAELGAQVVGATASLLLEVDEAQDVAIGKHDKDFAPMAASTNATRVYYGTAWDDTTLLQRQIEANLSAQARDGIRRHFAYPWDRVAEFNPAYGRYVEAERARLGVDHPLFRTQYELKVITGETGFFSPAHRAQLAGHQPRREGPVDGASYIAAIDVAGGSEDGGEAVATGEREQRQDSTVILIARVDWRETSEFGREPVAQVEQVYWWTGVDLRTQYAQIVDLCRSVWHVQALAVDATGLGRALADFLVSAFPPGVVEPVVVTSASKSELGYNLLAAIAGGRLKWYGAGDEDLESREFWHEVGECRYEVRPSRLMSWSVPESRGHDDFLAALALVPVAAAKATPPAASTVIAAKDPYGSDRRYVGGYS